jgi:hypothetical protein
LTVKHKGKRPLGRLKTKWAQSIRMDLKEFRWEGKNKILLTLDRDVDTGGEAKQHPSPHTEI